MSLRFILMEFGGLFEDENDREVSEDSLLMLLGMLSQWNYQWLKRNPKTPRLYESGVVYKLPEQLDDGTTVGNVVYRRGEHFRDVPAILENGGGDCDNLACWRVAELWVAGHRGVLPYITNRERPGGGRTYHALVYWPTPKPKGSTEDPSLLLGMGGWEHEPEREAERQKNRERVELKKKSIMRGIRLGMISPEAVRQAMAKKAGK